MSEISNPARPGPPISAAEPLAWRRPFAGRQSIVGHQRGNICEIGDLECDGQDTDGKRDEVELLDAQDVQQRGQRDRRQ
jgi:hypothetical protein